MSPIAASCHAPSAGIVKKDAPVIVLAGAPNVGKSTLFNALTNAKVTMGNWPGTTVEVSRGLWRPKREENSSAAQSYNVIDLPGSYSLDAVSPDEELARDLIDSPERPDVVVVAADAANLSRSLYLVAQLRERAQRVVVALTMADVAEAQGRAINPAVLADKLGVPVVAIDPRRRQNLAALATAVDAAIAESVPELREVPATTDELTLDDDRFSWIDAAVTAATTVSPAKETWSNRIDRFATGRFTGPLLFLAVMWAIFQLTTTVASPMQDFLDGLVSGPVSDAATSFCEKIGMGDTPFQSFLVDGLVAGVGSILTFVPLMIIMFALLALLEDSGYLARAAVVTDALMRRLGLPGRAFLPIVVGFGCNVPAISATRILPQAKQRILTSLLVPFTSCTARLAVYTLIATTFFGQAAGTVIFLMYVASIVMVILIGLILRKTLWRSMGEESLVLDLPAYQRPTLRLVLSVTWQRLKGFLKSAAGIIVAVTCAVWVLQAIPAPSHEGSFGDVPVENSVYGVAAQAVAPVFAPTGFGSWQTTSALTVGLVAKEAVLSSWAQTYAVADPEEDEGPLSEAVMGAFEESSGGHPLPAVVAFLIFMMAYPPCVAVMGAQRQEMGWKWMFFGIGMQLVTAYAFAVAIFQIGRLFW